MKTYYRIPLLLLAIVLLATPLQADTTAVSADLKWCGSFDLDANHPMYRDKEEHQKILQNIPIEKLLMQEKEFYQKLLDTFIASYDSSDDFDDPCVQITISTLRLYIDDLASKGPTPTTWNVVSSKQKPEIRLTGIGQYVGIHEPLRIACSVFKTHDPKSAVLGVAYLSRYVEALSRVRLDELQLWAAVEAYLTSKDYQSWIFKGLAQWPWELKLNEMLIPDKFNGDAPDWQWTFLRPNLGFAINPNDYNDADLDYALMLEPAGFIKYLKDDGKTDYEHWWGVSALVSITGDNGTGYGLMARYDNFMLGACKHDSQDQDWLIYLGVDLYKYLLGKDGKVKQYQKLKEKYGSSD
ncbi:MAG: hypothetical protein KAJ90_07625 [Desulfobacterales bacterium]|nr:hypothetical protein [Desulfobacterales bacterium]